VVARHVVDRGDSIAGQEEDRQARWERAHWELRVRCHLFEIARRRFLLESSSCFEGTRCGFRPRMTRRLGPVELHQVSRRIRHCYREMVTDIESVQELVFTVSG
jgi:hypothetical protein